MWGRRLLAIAAGVAVTATLGAVPAGAAPKTRTFSVAYSGSGKIVSRIRSQTSPDCGEVTEVRNETTYFSWVTDYRLTLRIGSSGFSKAGDQAQPKASPLASNRSTVTLSQTGCQTGIANCKGQSEPDPGFRASLEVSGAAAGGRSRFRVGAIGFGFVGKGFSGGWGFPRGSCASNFDTAFLALPEFPGESKLIAQFPVKVETLSSLRPGHYFSLRVSAGHYAPPHRRTCFAASGCLKDSLSWDGHVVVSRTS